MWRVKIARSRSRSLGFAEKRFARDDTAKMSGPRFARPTVLRMTRRVWADMGHPAEIECILLLRMKPC